MTDEFLCTHLIFKANLPLLYIIPITYKYCKFDHHVAYASKNLEQLSFWQNKRIRSLQFQFNFLKSVHYDLNSNPNDITTARSV